MEVIFMEVLFLLFQGGRTVWAYSDPIYIWPLVPSHVYAETSGTPPSGTSGCLSSDTGHPALDYNSLKLHGSTNSYLELPLDIPASTVQDFSIMLFISPEGTSGTVFNYEQLNQTTNSGEISKITLTYDNMTFYLNVMFNNSRERLIYTWLVASFKPGEWVSVVVSYDYSGRNFYLIANETSITNPTVIDVKILLGVPGKIRIGGGSHLAHSTYLGSVTCMQFFDDKITSGDFVNDLTNCLSATWPSDMGVETASLYPSCEAKKGYYQLISRTGTPPPSTQPMASLKTASKVKCADWCLLPSNACVSFAINKSQNVCNLYDVDDTSQLVFDTDTYYYVSNTLVNCC